MNTIYFHGPLEWDGPELLCSYANTAKPLMSKIHSRLNRFWMQQDWQNYMHPFFGKATSVLSLSLCLSFCLSHFVLFLHWPITLVMCYIVGFDKLLHSVPDKHLCRSISTHTHTKGKQVKGGRCREIGDSCWQISQETCQVKDLFSSTEITQFPLTRGRETGEKIRPLLNASRDGVRLVGSIK